jgi:hypothetical protein
MASRAKDGAGDTLAADDPEVRFSTLLPAALAGSPPHFGRVKAATKTMTKANNSFILRSSHTVIVSKQKFFLSRICFANFSGNY